MTAVRKLDSCLIARRTLAHTIAALVLLSALASVSRAWMQAAKPAFEVASVKRVSPEDARRQPEFAINPGTIRLRNLPLTNVIWNAFDVADYLIVGMPDWAWDAFDIEAKSPGADNKALWRMMQTLLAERFALKAHFETREMPAYFLNVTKNGPKMKMLSTSDCVEKEYSSDARANVCGEQWVSLFGEITLTNSGTRQLAQALSGALRRPVIDRTGIHGTFDTKFKFSTDENGRGRKSDAPSIFTAVQESLGLELKSGRGPAQVLVIDHLERPKEK